MHGMYYQCDEGEQAQPVQVAIPSELFLLQSAGLDSDGQSAGSVYWIQTDGGVLVLIQMACDAHGSPEGFQLILGVHHPVQGMEGQPPCWIREDLLLVTCPRVQRGDPDLC